MAKLSVDCKKLMVKEASDRLGDKDILIVTNYKGLTAKDLNELRRELRNVSCEYMVGKDSMIKKALAESANNRIAEFIEGEIGIAIDKAKDPTFLSKVLVKFAKDHEVMKIRGGIVKGELISKDDIKVLAALPSREVLLGKLANVLNAPIQGLAGVLHAIISKIVYALNAVKNQKTEDRRQRTEGKEQSTEDTEKSEQKSEETKAENRAEDTKNTVKDEKLDDREEKKSDI